MSYVYRNSEPTDDLKYVQWVETVITGVDEALKTDLFFVVKIDNWFGKRWLGFSGKTLGALGFRKDKLTLPPFIPTRVVSQHRFWMAGTDPGRRRRLHVWQRSGENLQRYTDIVLKDASAFWYSGRSAPNGRASFMAYISTPNGHWPWYVSLRRKQRWQVVECIGIGKQELDEFISRGLE